MYFFTLIKTLVWKNVIKALNDSAHLFPILKRLRPEGGEFKASLDYIMSLRPALGP